MEIKRLLDKLLNQETSRREFLIGVGFLGVALAGCGQPKETGATQVKKPESKPSYSSNIDERIIEKTRENGKEINDVVFKMKKICVIESGLVREWEPKYEIVLQNPDVYNTFFRTPEPFFEMDFFRLQRKYSPDEIVQRYLFDLRHWVIPFFVIHFLYDHPETLDKFKLEEEEKNKIIREVKEYVKNWDNIVLKNMKKEIEFHKDEPWRIFFHVDPKIAKKYEDKLQEVFKRCPKTTEIYFEELLPLMKKYGVRWRGDYERRGNEIRKGIKETLKYAGEYVEKMCKDKSLKREVETAEIYTWIDTLEYIENKDIDVSAI